MAAFITLVLGGTRSGKSAVAERLAAVPGAPVTYVATGAAPADDPDWADRVARHRRRRPDSWDSEELPDPAGLAAVVSARTGTVLVDSLGAWLARHERLAVDPGPLCSALVLRARAGHASVVVSEEVGLSVHPATEAGRRFADGLGELNQAVAAVADRVLLVVAGRCLELGGA